MNHSHPDKQAMADSVKAATKLTKRTREKNKPSVPLHIAAGKPSNPKHSDNDKKPPYDTVFFKSTRGANKRGDYTVHPEWASEVLAPPAITRLTITDRYATYPGRRARSAPGGGRQRNPITWEY